MTICAAMDPAVGGISLALIATSLSLVAIGLVTRALGKRGGACPKCGYNLTGLTANRCPECGHHWEGYPVFRPRGLTGTILIRVGVVGTAFGTSVLAIALFVSLASGAFDRSAHPIRPPDTTPPTLTIDFIAPDGDILSQSETKVRVKPGTELIVTSWAKDDSGFAGLTWYLLFNGKRYSPLGEDRLTVPCTPGTYRALGYARDVAGNETTMTYNIVVVSKDEENGG